MLVLENAYRRRIKKLADPDTSAIFQEAPATSSASSSKPPDGGGNTFGPEDDPHRYTIKEELGTGATATVCRCTKSDGTQYAVKSINLSKLRLQPNFQKVADKLHREVSILFTLRHPRIVSLYDVVEGRDHLHLVMELVEGGELFDHIVQMGSFTEPVARYVFIQIAEGLKYIHSQVSDPLKAAQGYNQRVDLWSLGVVLYVMLVGAYPFDGVREPMEKQIRQAIVTFPPDRQPSQHAQDLIRGLIKVRPQDRLTLDACLGHAWISMMGGSLSKIAKLCTEKEHAATEERLPLPEEPSKDKVEQLRRDLQQWTRKFRCAATVKHGEVVANMQTGLAEEDRAKARQELQGILQHHFQGSSTAEADLTPCSEVIVETTATTSTKTTTTADSTTGGISFTATTSTPGTGTTTTLENPGGPWSAYFSDETGSKGIAPGTGLVGLGCSGDFCGSIRLSHRADVQLSSQSVTIHQLDADVGDLMCQSGQVATQVTCIGSSCSSIRLHCATPLAGRVSLDLLERLWFPSELHGTEDSYCHGDDVVVGVYCGGANCMTKKLVCATYIADDECVPSCDILGLECGDDGCGGSCGTCSSEDSSLTPMCRGDVGRCVYFVAADWVNEDKSMTATNLVSTGMGCSDDYCGNVRLIQMNVFVDAATSEKSDWISDNTGHRWFWNSGTAASDQAADCPDGMAVSYLKCDGRHCDNLRLHCGKPLQWQVEMTEDPVVTDWFSEEQGRMDCPDGKVVTGVECQDSKKWCFTNCRSYCDNKRLRCRSIKPEMAGAAILGVVPAAELPTSAEPVPPSSSPWYEGAADTANNLWTGLSGVFQDSVSDAQPRGHRPLVTALAIRLLYYLS